MVNENEEHPRAENGPEGGGEPAEATVPSSQPGIPSPRKGRLVRKISYGVLGLIDEDTVIVPGHGDPVDRMFAFDQRARISGLYGQVEHLVRRGVKQDTAYETGEWPFDEDVVRSVLPLAYAQLAAAGLVPRTQLPLV